MDYALAWQLLVEAIRECADYRPQVRICIEYKMKEPRKYILVSTVDKALQLSEEAGRENVGVLLDIGHALAAGENPAESAALLHRKNKLFYVHFNDNHGTWDDDLIPGSVHPLHLLEVVYWLDKVGYDGWHALDIFPAREDGLKAVNESIRWIMKAYEAVDALDKERMGKFIASNDWLSVSALLRELL